MRHNVALYVDRPSCLLSNLEDSLSGAAAKLRKATRLRLKCDGTRAQTRFHLSVHLNWWGKSVQPTTGSRGVRISGSNAG